MEGYVCSKEMRTVKERCKEIYKEKKRRVKSKREPNEQAEGRRISAYGNLFGKNGVNRRVERGKIYKYN